MSKADAQAACAHAGDPVDVELYGQDAGILADDLLITKSAYAAAGMSLLPRVHRHGLRGLAHP